MKRFDEHPNLFRALFGAVAISLLVLAALNLHGYASYQTDENEFYTSPSKIYAVKNFAAQLDASGTKPPEASSAPLPDSIFIGDLLLRINGEDCDSLQQARQRLATFSEGEILELRIKRPRLNRNLRFQLRKAAWLDSAFREIPASVFISKVNPGGASERAGMLVGDLVYRINGRGFRDAYEADRIMRRAEANRAIAYEVLRDNREITLQVTLARFGARLHVFLGFLSGLSFWGLSIFLALSRPRLHAARLLALALLASSFPIMMIYLRVVSLDFLTTIALFLLPLSLLAAFPLHIHSSAYFPKERSELITPKWVIATPYLLAGFFYVLIFIGQVHMRVPLIAGLIALSLYVLLVLLLFRKKCSPEYKKLYRTLKWTCVLAGVLCIGIALFVMGDRPEIPRTGYIVLPLILIPAAYLYTIGRYRLLDLNLRIGRNVQYLVLSTLCGLALLVAFFFLLAQLSRVPIALPNLRVSGSYVEIVDEPLAPATAALGEKVLLMLLAIALVFVFRRLYRRVQFFLARKFYRTGYDYRRAVSELSEVMATKLDMLELAKGISRKLAEHIQLKRVGVLFFRNQNECCCEEAYGFDQGEWREFCVSIEPGLIEALQKFRSESRFSADYLPPLLKDTFQRHGFAHVMPIRFKERLVGALLVGEKLSEAGFHQDDLNYLSAVAKQASLAIENAFLYEELAEKERMKHELAIARRIQMASLPQTTPQIPGLDIAGVSIPALEVGGDYFDYLNGKPDQITVIVGDVSGKGTSAAMYMSKVQGILRSLHDFGLSPRELFIRANHLLREALDRQSFVTSIGACFDAGHRKLRLARAGHLPLYYYQARTRRIESVTPKGLGLGLDDDRLFASELEERSLSYEIGDVFLFVTDGVTEAQGEHGGEFGEESVTELLCKHFAEPAHVIRDRVITAVRSFVNGESQHDDLTIVVVKAV